MSESVCNCAGCVRYRAEVQRWIDEGGQAAWRAEVETYMEGMAAEYLEHLRLAAHRSAQREET